MKRRKRTSPIKICAVFLGILLFFAALFGYVFIAEYTVDFSARIVPSYEKIDLRELETKESWTEEDYEILYRQTGLSESALDALKAKGSSLKPYQTALFYNAPVSHSDIAITTHIDCILDDGYVAPLAPLEDGDILVTASTHSFGWRHGHAAIVVDASQGKLLESYALGTASKVSRSTSYFRTASNFMVLRLKDASAQERSEIAKAAAETLANIDYSLTVGIFSKKNQGQTPKGTQCAHLVWQAYMNFGYDVDCNGRLLVVPRDIARSPLLEVVQVNGFDLDKLW